jgi:hypothetical protein
VGINDNKTIDTVVEGRINVEIEKYDAAWFAKFGILLIERWYSGSEIA